MNILSFTNQIHFAAACTGSGPLQFLISQKANIWEPDDQGKTPLMIAAELGRYENVDLLTCGNVSPAKLKKIMGDEDLHKELAEELNKALKKNSE